MSSWNEKSLGNVQIGELIARGGMAEVYYGQHTSLNRKVAVKIMREHVDDDQESRVRFDREAQVIASLRHPNIIQIFDYELMDGRPYLIMELVPGPSLGGYLKALHKKGEKLPFGVVARILSSLASAIDYAHTQSIVHRDIKPSNVLLRSLQGTVTLNSPLPEDVEPILTDFGLVRLLDSSIQTSTGTVSGTPTYMSPEQARGERVDRRTDIYSLGVMLYEMLAGTVPFDAESSFGVLMKHLNDPPPPIEGLSTDLQAVIDRALAKDPSVRYGTAREFSDEFIAVFNGQTVSMDTAELAKMARNLGRPNRLALLFRPPYRRLWSWAVIGVLAVAGLAFFVLRPSFQNLANEDQALARASYSDFNAVMDKAIISFTDLPAPQKGSHYDVWYLAEGGEIRRNVGSISLDSANQGELVFINPEQENILSLFDQLEVTLEADDDPNPEGSSGEIIASSVFPPLALVHVRHVLVSYQRAPDAIALIQGLWETADRIDTSILEMQDAFQRGDEELFRLRNEEIINQLVGSTNTDLYLDWNGNGKVDDPGDHFGLLPNGDQGYINQTTSHARFAAEAEDATDTIIIHSGHVVISIENMRGWSEQLLEKALQLQKMPFGAEAGPLVVEMQSLSRQILFGMDTNGNELVEPIIGEGGADTAYQHSYYMAEMPLLIGEHRIPPPATTTAHP